MLTFTKNTYEKLNQADFKKVVIWRVEETQNRYAKRIREIDYQCFLTLLLELKINRDGTIPKNLNRAFYVKGATLDEKFVKDYGRLGFILKTKNGNFRIYTRAEKSYRNDTIVVASILPCDDNGYTRGECYEVSFKFDSNSVVEFEELKKNIIAKYRATQKDYIEKLRNIPKVAKQIEKLNLYGLYTSEVQKWF